jgi:oligopeptide/dipeptide ABC transporter ATP-binding protein
VSLGTRTPERCLPRFLVSQSKTGPSLRCKQYPGNRQRFMAGRRGACSHRGAVSLGRNAGRSIWCLTRIVRLTLRRAHSERSPVSNPDPADAKVFLEATDLKKAYPVRGALQYRRRGEPSKRVVALDGVSLRLDKGQGLGLVGESGSGKSTLARCLVRAVEPDSGKITLAGEDVMAAGARELAAMRRRVQLVYQDPYSSLNPRLRAGMSIAEPARVHGLVANKEEEDLLVASLLERVGLPRSAGARRPRELSGGQRQRVAIARALSVRPDILLADEAVSALDVSIQAQILHLLRDLRTELGLGILFIAHQLPLIAQLCERVAVMYLGRIVEEGPTERVFTRPGHPYTIALLRANPDPSSHTKARSPALSGEIPSPLAVPEGCRFHTRCAFAEERCRNEDPPRRQLAPGHVSWCHINPLYAGDSKDASESIAQCGTREPNATGVQAPVTPCPR